eukprot:1185354-Prorocentrum_minimum.AAC.1
MPNNEVYEGQHVAPVQQLTARSFAGYSDEVEDRYDWTFRSPPISPGCRVVEVALTVERVFDVDTVTQTFGVQVTVMMSWLMPEFEEPKPKEMDDGDWEPEWTPKYQFNNLMVRPCAVSLFSTLQQANIDEKCSYTPYKDQYGIDRIMMEAQHVVRIYEQMVRALACPSGCLLLGAPGGVRAGGGRC